MGVRDRFFTPQTAAAILSWRIAVGVGVAVALAVAGLQIVVSVAVGLGLYIGLVLASMPGAPPRVEIDPFTLSEPWRRLVQQAQGSRRKLRQTIDGIDDGPVAHQLVSVADQLDRGLREVWEVAQGGDRIDEMVRRLDPTRLRSKLATLRADAGDSPSPDVAATITSVEEQLATAERLDRRSAETADSLRRTQTRLDELVARATEVRLGMVDTDSYARDVDDLVVRLEALHQAVEETRGA